MNSTEQYCFQFVKDKEFESNSQPGRQMSCRPLYCFQFVKDKEFESNSQLENIDKNLDETVFSLSKIKNLKAIHNQHFIKH